LDQFLCFVERWIGCCLFVCLPFTSSLSDLNVLGDKKIAYDADFTT
jgi:hypothetical protein